VAETVAKSKDRLSKVDLKARIARLSAEIEAVAGETGADIAKTAKKAADKTSKAMKAAVAAPEASDDLSQITGVGPAMVKKLNDAGIYSFAQLAAMKKAEAEALDAKIGARGRVIRDEWVKQAKALARSNSRIGRQAAEVSPAATSCSLRSARSCGRGRRNRSRPCKARSGTSPGTRFCGSGRRLQGYSGSSRQLPARMSVTS
jgi:predicted flap endonuclease-1-like 5' DNA nuclease